MHFKRSVAIYILALTSYLAVYLFYSRSVHQLPVKSKRVGSKGPNDGEISAKTLKPPLFSPLPLGSVRPTHPSWIDNELRNSARGLAGHLWDFYAFVKDSTWVSNATEERGEYSGLHEGFPYWLNGLVHLAYSVSDVHKDETGQYPSEAARLKNQVHIAVHKILDAQSEDGWLGPETATSGKRLLWARFPLLLGLISLAEANATWKTPVLHALRNFTKLTHSMLKHGGKGLVSQGVDDKNDYSYGMVRIADLLLAFQWLFEHEQSDPEQRKILWECMEYAYSRSAEWRWEDWYLKGTYLEGDISWVPKESPLRPFLHGVNVAQGLKTPAVVYRFTHNASLLNISKDAVDWTFKYHGAASGTILGDERLTGLAPWRGSELCTTVETMFSLTKIYHIIGDNSIADRVERIAFNALPSMLLPNHSAHQYVSQPNQPWSKRLSSSPFFDTNAVSQTFGLEPHYPCCTVNHPQGLPKFLAGSWVRFGRHGLAHVLLSPGSVKVDGIHIECRTEYPFTESLNYIVNANKSISLYLRIPGWTYGRFSVTSDSTRIETKTHADLHLHEVKLPAGKHTLLYNLEATINVEPRANDAVAIHRGALLYALPVQNTSRSYTPKAYNESKYSAEYAPYGFQDWVLENASAWNIAIDQSILKFEREINSDLPYLIWAPGAPSIFITVTGCEINWPLYNGTVPGAPPPMRERKCINNHTRLWNLIPLGKAKLHMVDLPTIDIMEASKALMNGT